MSSSTTKTPKDLKPLIDGDVLCYRCGFAADGKVRKELKKQFPDACPESIEGLVQQEDYLAFALQNVKTTIEAMLERFNPEYKLYLHHSGNYREQLATLRPYKGTRDEKAKPKYYDEIKQYMFEVWNAIPVRGMESDDAIGLEQFQNSDKYTVIVSIDKDMDCIPGWHYNWVQKRLYYQSITDADLFFFYQMLTGDTIDNIPGIDQVGEKRAHALIEKCRRDLPAVRNSVQELYQKQYADRWKEAYTEVGNLLWILRRPEQLHDGCPLLW